MATAVSERKKLDEIRSMRWQESRAPEFLVCYLARIGLSTIWRMLATHLLKRLD